MKQELERYLTANGVWFSDKEYKLGTRDLLNILSVVSNFCVKHIKFIVAPLFDHLEPTYIVYFSDKLLNDSDFRNLTTLKTDNINTIDPKIDTTIKSEEQKEMNHRNDIIVADDVNNLLESVMNTISKSFKSYVLTYKYIGGSSSSSSSSSMFIAYMKI